MSALSDCFFYIFAAAAAHICIRNVRTPNVMAAQYMFNAVVIITDCVTYKLVIIQVINC